MILENLKIGTLILDGVTNSEYILLVIQEYPNFKFNYVLQGTLHIFFSDGNDDLALDLDTIYADIFCA